MSQRARLTHEQQVFLVQELARFSTPTQAAAAVKAQFGVEVSLPLACWYTPKPGSDLPPKWVKLFEETREAFIADIASIPIAHRAVRLRILNRLVDAAVQKQRPGLVAQLLRQAAEEMGDKLTNRAELTGAGGAPLAAVQVYLPSNGRE